MVVAQCQSLASSASNRNSHTGSSTASLSSVFSNNLTNSLAQAATVSFSTTYYFPHFALGGGWQTVLTYVNYSPGPATCQTDFYGDDGTPLAVPFADTGSSPTRTDSLAAGGELHQQSQVDPTGPQVNGWAIGQCTGPVKASLLFRLFSGGTAVGEAGVNATTTPSNQFVTYAQTLTGVAWANPSTTTGANVTISALNASGVVQKSISFNVPPMQHSANNIGPMLGITNFTGSVQVSADQPIVSLSINAEAFPAFSSLPPGDLDGTIPLADGTGKGSGNANAPTTYYLPHFAIAGGWQTVLTYVNFSNQTVSCTTNFFGDDGSPLAVNFGAGASATRNDVLAPGGEIHQISQANTSGTAVTGWAQGQCTGPVKASLLFRLFANGTAIGEAGVNASTVPTTEFVSYAQTAAGFALANVSPAAAVVTITALDSTGAFQGTTSVNLNPNAHYSNNVGPLLGIGGFNGSVQITSTQPLVSLSLNAEAFPAFSSLPPGDLAAGTALAPGH